MEESRQRTALITGGCRGIGKGITKILRDNNFKTITVGVSHCDNDYNVDLSIPEEIDRLSEQLFDHNIDILINNAGIVNQTEFLNITPQVLSKIINVNLSSVFYMTQKFLPNMIKQGWGRVITVSSLVGHVVGHKNLTHYGATKAGLVGFTKCLADEINNKNVTINVILPGCINTRINKLFLFRAPPGTRYGEVEDVAQPVLDLCLDSSNGITGKCLQVLGSKYK
ncbi:hypothetical protein CL622_03675 [archaeon]|nr:hypothetical protein [archaeon]|tara:strand:- start:1758 stop:2432 length:675 start_codon:yes stop_codon:yes gene_type:complete